MLYSIRIHQCHLNTMKEFRQIVWILWALLQLGHAAGYRGTFSKHKEGEFESMINTGLLPDYRHLIRVLVSIRTLNYISNKGDNHFCTGVIIGQKNILTAAHCVTSQNKGNMSPRSLLIVFGIVMRLDNYEQSFTRYVEKIYVHPKYRRYINYDVAVLLTVNRVPVNTREVIKLKGTRMYQYYTGMRCVTLGWGQLYQHGPYADEVIYLTVIMRDASFCKDMKHFEPEATICAEPDFHGQICAGDMGGPLFCLSDLVGIIGGAQECEGGKSIKFVNYSSVLDWVEVTINASSAAIRIWISQFLLILLVTVIPIMNFLQF